MLGSLAATRPGPMRLMIPILLVAYMAPLVVGPERIAAVLRRGGRAIPGRPMKDVTPPDDRPDQDA